MKIKLFNQLFAGFIIAISLMYLFGQVSLAVNYLDPNINHISGNDWPGNICEILLSAISVIVGVLMLLTRPKAFYLALFVSSSFHFSEIFSWMPFHFNYLDPFKVVFYYLFSFLPMFILLLMVSNQALLALYGVPEFKFKRKPLIFLCVSSIAMIGTVYSMFPYRWIEMFN